MKENFEKIEKHLYRRQYQTAGEDWQTAFYSIFVDWKGKRRKFPLGARLDDARDKLGELRTLNKGRYDFDKEKEDREQAKIRAITVSEWLDRYLELVKGMPSHVTKLSQCAHLKRLLGHLPLSDVNRVRIMEYKSRRLSEPLMRYGLDGSDARKLKPVDGTRVMGATVNREVSCLITALNLAADNGLCEGAPKVKKERETPRERTLTDAEYQAVLDASPRWLQRVLIAANETAIDQGVLLKLTWDSVREGLVVVKGGRAKTGVKQRVAILPALEEVLRELRSEYRRVPNMDKRIFTKDGKAIPKGTLRHAFDKALREAELEDFKFKDFRHCARTRWAAAGLPFEVAENGMGHTIKGVAGRYINLSDDEIREAWLKTFPRLPQGNQTAAGGNQ